MKLFKVSIIVMFISCDCLSGLWAIDAGWEKIGESDGIVGYTRPTTKSSVDELKGIGIVEAPVAVVEAVIRDVSAQTEYIYKCKEASVVNTPEFTNTTDTVHIYNVTSMPFPVYDRDVVAKSEYTLDKSTGTVRVHFEGVNTSYRSDKKKVRMPIMIGETILVPKGPDKTEVTCIVLADPGGNLPSMVVNLFTKNLCIQTIAGIRKMVTKDKYKNVKSVVTTTPASKRTS